MWHRLSCLILLLGMLPLEVQVQAWEGQQLVTLPGGFHRVQMEELDRQLGGQVKSLAVTLLPTDTVAYLDGRPLPWGHQLDRDQLERVYLFSPRRYVWMGVLPIQEPHQLTKSMHRIRCINPTF